MEIGFCPLNWVHTYSMMMKRDGIFIALSSCCKLWHVATKNVPCLQYSIEIQAHTHTKKLFCFILSSDATPTLTVQFFMVHINRTFAINFWCSAIKDFAKLSVEFTTFKLRWCKNMRGTNMGMIRMGMEWLKSQKMISKWIWFGLKWTLFGPMQNDKKWGLSKM